MPSSKKRSSSTQNRRDSSSQGDLIVEKVVDQQLENGKLKFLVKWKGLEELTWEDAYMWVPYTTDSISFTAPRISQSQEPDVPQRRRPKSLSASPASVSLRKFRAKSRQRGRTVRFEAPPVPAERPPPVLIDGTLHYEVEQVLQSRVIDGVLHFLIHWVGYAESESTWEPAANVFAEDKVAEFYLAQDTP